MKLRWVREMPRFFFSGTEGLESRGVQWVD